MGSESVASFQNMLSNMFKSGGGPVEGGISKTQRRRRRKAVQQRNAERDEARGRTEALSESEDKSLTSLPTLLEQRKSVVETKQDIESLRRKRNKACTASEKGQGDEGWLKTIKRECKRLTDQVNELEQKKHSDAGLNTKEAFTLQDLRREQAEKYNAYKTGVVTQTEKLVSDVGIDADDSPPMHYLHNELEEKIKELEEICNVAQKDGDSKECDKLKAVIAQARRALRDEMEPFEADAESEEYFEEDYTDRDDIKSEINNYIERIRSMKKVSIEYAKNSTENTIGTFDVKNVVISEDDVQFDPLGVKFVVTFEKDLPEIIFGKISFQIGLESEPSFIDASFDGDNDKSSVTTIKRVDGGVLFEIMSLL